MALSRVVGGLVATGLLAAAGCASVAGPREPAPLAGIEGIVIRNDLPYPVYDVVVEAPATGGFAGCGMILRRSRCATSFPVAAWRGEALVVRWTEHGVAHTTGEVDLESLAAGGEAGPPVAWLEVIVYAPGQAGARLVRNPAP